MGQALKGCVVIYSTDSVNPFLWDNNFPPVYGHTSISYLKSCSGFEEAKNGDLSKALKVVDMCIKPDRIFKLRERYLGAVLLPVITNNRLPEAFALRIGMRVHKVKCKPGCYCRKNLPAMERLLLKPGFDGDIDTGAKYIIVDDIVTQGGTISELRRFVLRNGGTVAAATALAFSADSGIIAPEKKDVSSLVDKFSSTELNAVLREYGIAGDVRELTRSQVRYLLRFEKIESMRRKQERTQYELLCRAGV